MRKTTDRFLINGRPMLAPDAEVSVSYEDIDGADAGRDESGFLHRSLLRRKVASWNFSYSHITEEEKRYMESLFPEDGTFTFTCPSRVDAGQQEEMDCYRSKYTISWYNATLGLWSGYGFRIIQC